MRVGVVGAIKSGKSTFLNALLGGEYLKRGAGVVTSIVTRIREGRHPVARLVFKSWSDVNQEMSEALALIPAAGALTDGDHFDIRDSEKRAEVRKLLDGLPVEQVINQGSRNLNTALLTCYLGGYDRITEFLASENSEIKYVDDRFFDHWQFVGDDTLAVYLKDLALELDGRNLDSDTEFADCQGSDSPNPMHLAMIQDYLQQAHLIIYLISSRTGLREADIKFLSIIRKMGLIDNVLYVLNTDISEHESLRDLHSLSDRVANELGLMASGPEIYTFSALHKLFGLQPDRLPEKDRLRLEQWNKQTEIVGYSKNEHRRFQTDLDQRLAQKRYRFMVKSQIERHSVILAGMGDWISINRELLSRSGRDATDIVEGIARQQERMGQIKKVIETTAAGAVPEIKRKLNADINRFFDTASGQGTARIVDFVRNYRVDLGKFEDELRTSGFMNTLYLVFQEFKKDLDKTMTDVVYPDVFQFVRREEEEIEKYFRSIYEPYEGIVAQGLADLRNVLDEFGIDSPFDKGMRKQALPGVADVREAAGLKLPAPVTFLQYSAKMRTEAFVHLGFFSALNVFSKAIKKKKRTSPNAQFKALQRSVRRMKKQTEESILFQCKNYRENLKFSYLYKLSEEVSLRLAETLMDRFRAFGDSTAAMSAYLNRQKTDRDNAAEMIKELEIAARSIGEKIAHLREQIEHADS